MTLTYRSEYKEERATRLDPMVLLPQEWLCQHLDCLKSKPGEVEGTTYRLLIHCTERTNVPASPNDWKCIFKQLGVGVEIADTGCCGMAGTFGHEVRNRRISEKLYAMSWKPVIDRAGGDEILMATGYSCRSHAKRIDRVNISHPIQAINGLILRCDSG